MLLTLKSQLLKNVYNLRIFFLLVFSKEKRLMESAIAADPTVYEYDSIYDELERKKNLKTEVQEKSDKEKKVNFIKIYT